MKAFNAKIDSFIDSEMPRKQVKRFIRLQKLMNDNWGYKYVRPESSVHRLNCIERESA
jgi:hypothetical protein